MRCTRNLLGVAAVRDKGAGSKGGWGALRPQCGSDTCDVRAGRGTG